MGSKVSTLSLKKGLAPDRLTVPPVLDLDPGGRFRRVPGVRLLGDNPFPVQLANRAEQVRAACHVIHEPNRLRPQRQQLPQQCLSLEKRPFPQVAGLLTERAKKSNRLRPVGVPR